MFRSVKYDGNVQMCHVSVQLHCSSLPPPLDLEPPFFCSVIWCFDYNDHEWCLTPNLPHCSNGVRLRVLSRSKHMIQILFILIKPSVSLVSWYICSLRLPYLPYFKYLCFYIEANNLYITKCTRWDSIGTYWYYRCVDREGKLRSFAHFAHQTKSKLTAPVSA